MKRWPRRRKNRRPCDTCGRENAVVVFREKRFCGKCWDRHEGIDSGRLSPAAEGSNDSENPTDNSDKLSG